MQSQLLAGSFACPTCGSTLTRTSFRQGAAESFQAEIKTRKRLSKIFNETRADFPSDRAFFDYEEWVEDITYKIVHGIDKAGSEAIVARYMKDNQAAIIERNREQEVRARAALQQLQAEQALADARREEMLREAAEEASERRKQREIVLSKVQLGQLVAGSLETELEAGLKRRLKRKQALAEDAAAAGEAADADSQGFHTAAADTMYAPTQMAAAKNVPKPVGMTLHAATRAERQKDIVSHRGVLSEEELERLLETCVATGYTRQVPLKRGRELALAAATTTMANDGAAVVKKEKL